MEKDTFHYIWRYRRSYMSANVLYKMSWRKSDEMQGLPSILSILLKESPSRILEHKGTL